MKTSNKTVTIIQNRQNIYTKENIIVNKFKQKKNKTSIMQ